MLLPQTLQSRKVFENVEKIVSNTSCCLLQTESVLSAKLLNVANIGVSRQHQVFTEKKFGTSSPLKIPILSQVTEDAH